MRPIDGTWNDFSCNLYKSYICEKEKGKCFGPFQMEFIPIILRIHSDNWEGCQRKYIIVILNYNLNYILNFVVTPRNFIIAKFRSVSPDPHQC